MILTVQLPDDIAQHPDPARETVEAVAIEAYRAGTLTHHQAAQLLRLSRFEFDGFLKQHGVTEHAYDAEDLERDLATLRSLEP